MRKELKGNLLKALEEAPERPGVYTFKGKGGAVLYVGKAKSLKDRLKSYLQESVHPRTRKLQTIARGVEIFVTDSEKEALLLEASLIKRLQPRYNVKLKDDKKYPYLKITIRERYPRIYPTRDLRDDGSLIFGPFTHARSLRKTLRTLRKIFPLRTCKYRLPSRRKISPCVDYYLRICTAPCFFDVKREEYMKDVQGVVDFLSGKLDIVERRLEDDMKEAAMRMAFEKAAELRDQLLAIRETLRGQKIVSKVGEVKDLVALSFYGDYSLALILQVRGGIVAGKETYLLDPAEEEDEARIVGAFLAQYYSTSTLVTRVIVVEPLPEDAEVLERVLEERVGEKVKLRKPSGEEERRLYALAKENAERLLEEEISKRGEGERVPRALTSLKEALMLEREPRWIEAVDISQLFGGQPVGSVVVFVNGKPKKSEYRRYRIKRVEKGEIDDFKMIEQVVARRFRRLKEEGKTFPDLVLIDGGKGQLNFARKALDSLGVYDVSLVAIAKRFDELHLEDGRVLMLERRSPALKLLQRIRDEAHRFAIGYHRALRGKESLLSLLDSIPGIGKSKRRRLLQYFGSISNLFSASPEEISRVKGVGPTLAEKIYRFLHGW